MARPLPPVAAPFVTAPTYTVRPDLTRLGQLPAHVRDPAPATLVRLDADAPRSLAHALRELSEAPEAVRAVDPRADEVVLRAAARGLARALAAEGDPRVAIEGDALVCRWLGLRIDPAGRLAAVPLAADAPPALAALAPLAAAWLAAQAADASARATLALDALALALQEDLVVLTRRGIGGRAASGGCAASGGRAAYLNVVAPSGWDPGAHAGSSFAQLHAPVPQRAALDAAAGALVAALVARGPFVRHVWSLAPDDALGRHPLRGTPTAAVAPERLVYRVERQTTLPVPEADAAVFLIRVYTTPLAQVVAVPAQRAALASAVATMDEALLDYKGLRGGRAALLDWLGHG